MFKNFLAPDAILPGHKIQQATGVSASLSTKAFFRQKEHQVLLKEQILGHVWDNTGNFVDENTLQVTIGRLRRKLEKDPANPVYIRTVRGMGYIFAP